SGMSAAVLCYAGHLASKAGTIRSRFEVATYDISPRCYFDQNHRVGDAAREILPARLLEFIRFRNPANSADVARDYRQARLRFLFIDAMHRHPWPTLDLLTTLD